MQHNETTPTFAPADGSDLAHGMTPANASAATVPEGAVSQPSTDAPAVEVEAAEDQRVDAPKTSSSSREAPMNEPPLEPAVSGEAASSAPLVEAPSAPSAPSTSSASEPGPFPAAVPLAPQGQPVAPAGAGQGAGAPLADPYAPPVLPQQAAPSGALVPVSTPPSTGQSFPPVQLLDITIDGNGVHSPRGSLPLEGAQIQIVNRTQMTQAIPTWAIVLAVVGFFIVAIFSLLFLLAKENRLSGGYEVVVTSPHGTVTAFVPVTAQTSSFAWNDLHARADEARRRIAATTVREA